MPAAREKINRTAEDRVLFERAPGQPRLTCESSEYREKRMICLLQRDRPA